MFTILEDGNIPENMRTVYIGLCDTCKCKFSCQEIDGSFYDYYGFIVKCPYCTQKVRVEYINEYGKSKL